MIATAATALLAVLAAAGGHAWAAGAAVGDAGKAWVGTQYPPVPREAVILRGTSIGPADSATFALAEMRVQGQHLLWLARRARMTAAGQTWTVMDVLALPPLSGDRWLMLAICGMRREGAGGSLEPDDVAVDPEIVAIVRPGSDAVLTSIEQAWRADRSTAAFEPIPASGVACLNDVEPEP